MIWLLVRHQRNIYSLYSPSTYGMETWGMNSQRSLDKKQKHWYASSWTAGNEYVDDLYDECRLNVVVETTDISEIVRFMYQKKCSKEQIKEILDKAQEEFKNYIDFEKWGLR